MIFSLRKDLKFLISIYLIIIKLIIFNFHVIFLFFLIGLCLFNERVSDKSETFKFFVRTLFRFQRVDSHVSEFLVEILQSQITFYFGNIKRFVFFLIDVIPIDSVKPRMVFDFLSSVFSAESLTGIFLQKTLQKLFSGIADVFWIVGVLKFYFVEKFCSVLGIKRWNAHDHFINNRAKSPPICWLSIALFQHYFRSQIFWSSTHCSCFVLIDF